MAFEKVSLLYVCVNRASIRGFNVDGDDSEADKCQANAPDNSLFLREYFMTSHRYLRAEIKTG